MKTFFLAVFFFLNLSSLAVTITIPARTNLTVHWKAPKHPWPKILSTYSIERAIHSTVNSNLMVLGSFSEANKIHDDSDTIAFSDSRGLLRIKPQRNEIEFIASRTDAQENVPETNQLIRLTTNLVSRLGIPLSEIRTTKNRLPEIIFTPYRSFHTAWFYRLIKDIGCDAEIGFGRIDFGNEGKIVGMSLNWPRLQNEKPYAAISPEQIIQVIHEGRAIQQSLKNSSNGFETVIEWPTVKSLTVTEAKAHYRECSPDRVCPCAWLSGIVDTGKEKLNIEIICPVIDESKPLN